MCRVGRMGASALRPGGCCVFNRYHLAGELGLALPRVATLLGGESSESEGDGEGDEADVAEPSAKRMRSSERPIIQPGSAILKVGARMTALVSLLMMSWPEFHAVS